MPSTVNLQLILVWFLCGLFHGRGLGDCCMARRAYPFRDLSQAPQRADQTSLVGWSAF